MKFAYNLNGEKFVIEANSEEEADVLLESHVLPDMMQSKKDRPTDAPMQQAPQMPQVPQQPQAPQMPQMPQQGPAPAGPRPVDQMLPLDRYREAALGGAKNVYLGAKNLVGQGTPEEQAQRVQIGKRQEEMGIPGMIGGGVGEALTTAPLSLATGGAGTLISMLPKAKQLASMGGKAFNLGKVARGATEGAAAGGIVGDASDKGVEDRGDDAASGAFFGGVLPAAGMAGGLAKKMLSPLAKALGSKSKAVQEKAYDVAMRTFGAEGVENAMRAINHSAKPVLPQTTAALTGDPVMAAQERGARLRNNVDWQSSDEATGRAAWNAATRGPDRFRSNAGKEMMDTFERNGIPTTSKVYGDETTGRVPGLTDYSLRGAMGKASAGLTTRDKENGLKLADALRAFEKAATGPGDARVDPGKFNTAVSTALGAASALFGSTELWKARSVFNSVTGGSKGAVVKVYDEALADPQKFKALINDVQARLKSKKELSPTDKAFVEAVMGTSRALAIDTPEK